MEWVTELNQWLGVGLHTFTVKANYPVVLAEAHWAQPNPMGQIIFHGENGFLVLQPRSASPLSQESNHARAVRLMGTWLNLFTVFY